MISGSSDEITITPTPWFASALAGAFFAGMVMAAMVLRARGQTPAATTARLEELQSRIQPHFLFNTLNSVSGLVGEGRAQEAEAMLQNLAAFFRYSLTSAPNELTALDQEIAGQRLYLAVEEVRFSDRLSVRYDLDEKAGSALVPSLILQPLVENAIIHGLARSTNAMTLEIGSRVEGREVHLWVADDVAAGLPEPSTGLGFGLKNVRDRLESHFNGAARLVSEPRAVGWVSEIWLPFDMDD